MGKDAPSPRSIPRCCSSRGRGSRVARVADNDEDLAHDLTQETFVAACARRRAIAARTAAVARRVLQNLLRQRRRWRLESARA
jgi:hypothetical protein